MKTVHTAFGFLLREKRTNRELFGWEKKLCRRQFMIWKDGSEEFTSWVISPAKTTCKIRTPSRITTVQFEIYASFSSPATTTTVLHNYIVDHSTHAASPAAYLSLRNAYMHYMHVSQNGN